MMIVLAVFAGLSSLGFVFILAAAVAAKRPIPAFDLAEAEHNAEFSVQGAKHAAKSSLLPAASH